MSAFIAANGLSSQFTWADAKLFTFNTTVDNHDVTALLTDLVGVAAATATVPAPALAVSTQMVVVQDDRAGPADDLSGIAAFDPLSLDLTPTLSDIVARKPAAKSLTLHQADAINACMKAAGVPQDSAPIVLHHIQIMLLIGSSDHVHTMRTIKHALRTGPGLDAFYDLWTTVSMAGVMPR